MRRTIFAQTYGIVRQHINGRNFCDRCQAHGGAHIVSEVEKGAAERAQLNHRNAIQRGAHGVFADAKMNVPSPIVLGTEYASAFELQVSLV